MPKHTPEKWEVRMIGKEVAVAVVGSGKIIAFVETEENARIISAARELLDAAKHWHAYDNPMHRQAHPDCVYCAAIDKAEGRK